MAPPLNDPTGAARLRLLAYSLCLALFFALTIIPSPVLAIFAPATLCLFPAPMLDRVLPLAAFDIDDPDAARCDASFAITFEREIRGFRPGSTFAFIGTGFL
jgi:hypothetical protein